jgi:hypothetical protein
VLHRFLIAAQALFWVAISILQLDEITLYASGLALLEQNLHTLDSQNTFETESLETVMLATREPLEWHFKPLDHSVGLSFRHVLCIRNRANISDPSLSPDPSPYPDRVLLIQDFFIQDPEFFHSGSRIRIKEFKYFSQKIVSKLSEILIWDFYP